MKFTTLLLATACACATMAGTAHATAYVVTVTGTLTGAWDNAGIFGPAKTSLNGKAFTATFQVDEDTPGSYHALNTPNQRMLVGLYAASPVLGSLTVNGITRQVQPLQGTVYVIDNFGSVSRDNVSFKASSDNYDGGVYYDDWVQFGATDWSNAWLSSTVVPATFSYTVPGALATSGNFRFQNSRDGYLADGQFAVTGFTIVSQAQTPAVPEPASWALMIGGFSLAGAAMRRRGPARSLRLNPSYTKL
jgi:hypothetical protein